MAFGLSLTDPWASSAQAADNAGCPSASEPVPAGGIREVSSLAELMWVKAADIGSSNQQWGSSYRYEQTADINMTGCTWETGIGNGSDYFLGTYDGGGFAITNLTVSKAATDYLGLFGAIGSTAVIRDLSITGATISGAGYIGILAGASISGATVSDITTSGTVNATGRNVGGLIGQSDGSVTNSTSTATVTNTSDQYAGGLVGFASGAISNSSATGSVEGTVYVGGLAGYSSADITDSNATGGVTGTTVAIGGLVGGLGGGSIEDSFAQGNVTATGAGSGVGGLIGNMNASGEKVLRSSASGRVAGTGSYYGGLIGSLQNGSVEKSFSTGSVVAPGADQVGGLVGSVSSGGNAVDDSHASGDVTGNQYVGGLFGYSGNSTQLRDSFAVGEVAASSSGGGLIGRVDSTTASNSFWDEETSNQTSSSAEGAGAVTGETTANMKTLSTFVNATWDIGDGWQSGETWGICDGTTYPFLTWQYDSSPCSLVTPTVDTAESTSSGFTFNVTNYDSDYTYSFSATAGSASAGTASGSDLPVTVIGVSGGASSTVTVTASRTGYAPSDVSLTGRATGGGSGGSGGTPSTPAPTSEPTTSPTIPTIQVSSDSLLLDPDGGPLVVAAGGAAAYSGNRELPTPEVIQDGSLWTAAGPGYAVQVLGPQPRAPQARSTTAMTIPSVENGRTVTVAARGYAPGSSVRAWLVSSRSSPTAPPVAVWTVDETGATIGNLVVDVPLMGSHTIQVRGIAASESVLTVLFGLEVTPQDTATRFLVTFRTDSDALTTRSRNQLASALEEGETTSTVNVTIRHLRSEGSAGIELARERKRTLRAELLSLGVPRSDIEISNKSVKKPRFARSSIVEVRST